MYNLTVGLWWLLLPPQKSVSKYGLSFSNFFFYEKLSSINQQTIIPTHDQCMVGLFKCSALRIILQPLYLITSVVPWEITLLHL